MPYFSIIIPIYNVAPYLRECLDSVLAQTFTDWEAICVDDGSTDGSGAILDEYAAKDKRINVIHKKNEGVSVARNVGLDIAKGEYILFLDSDDAFEFCAFEIIYRILRNANADLLFFGHQNVTAHIKEKDNKLNFLAVEEFKCYYLEKVADVRAAFRQVVGSLLAWNGCFRRSTLGFVRFESGMSNGEDVLYGTACFCNSNKVLVSSAKLYRYFLRPGSAVRQMNIRHLKNSLIATLKMAEIIQSWRFFSEVRDLSLRKIRTSLMGVGYGVYNHLPREEREEGWAIFSLMVSRVIKLDIWRGLYKMFYRMAICSKLSAFIFLRIPWLCRACLSIFRNRIFGMLRKRKGNIN